MRFYSPYATQSELKSGIGSLQGDMSYSEGLGGLPSLGVIGGGPSPYSRPLPSEPITAPIMPFGEPSRPLVQRPLAPVPPAPQPFGGAAQGGIMSALEPHKRALYEAYNPKKVDRFFQRVEQMSSRLFPGYAGGEGPELMY
jgi:hypothetical protein